MAVYKFGNIFDIGKKEIILVTTNRELRGSPPQLVMGAGAAKQAKQLYPSLPKLFGKYIKQHKKYIDFYGIIPPYSVGHNVGDKGKKLRIGALQTKVSPYEQSDLKLVKNSLKQLHKYALDKEEEKINCIMPGIGLGNLDFWQVLELTDPMPDNVIFWMMPKKVQF